MSNLVLGRSEMEETVIVVPPSDRETEIVIQYVGQRQQQAKLLFTAPRDVKILRRELLGKERAAK